MFIVNFITYLQYQVFCEVQFLILQVHALNHHFHAQALKWFLLSANFHVQDAQLDQLIQFRAVLMKYILFHIDQDVYVKSNKKKRKKSN